MKLSQVLSDLSLTFTILIRLTVSSLSLQRKNRTGLRALLWKGKSQMQGVYSPLWDRSKGLVLKMEVTTCHCLTLGRRSKSRISRISRRSEVHSIHHSNQGLRRVDSVSIAMLAIRPRWRSLKHTDHCSSKQLHRGTRTIWDKQAVRWSNHLVQLTLSSLLKALIASKRSLLLKHSWSHRITAYFRQAKIRVISIRPNRLSLSHRSCSINTTSSISITSSSHSITGPWWEEPHTTSLAR